MESPAGQQILSVLQLQVYDVPTECRTLQYLVKNGSMAQAELLRQLLVGLLHHVLLGRDTCLALLLAATSTGLHQLHAPALACAEASFPACTAKASVAFHALPVGTVKRLLEHALQQVSCL